MEVRALLKDSPSVRATKNSKDKITDLLIKFDSIGFSEDLELVQHIDMTKMLGVRGTMPSLTHSINISITTNGTTKFLKISDLNTPFVHRIPTSAKMGIQNIFDLHINQMLLSLVH